MTSTFNFWYCRGLCSAFINERWKGGWQTKEALPYKKIADLSRTTLTNFYLIIHTSYLCQPMNNRSPNNWKLLQVSYHWNILSEFITWIWIQRWMNEMYFLWMRWKMNSAFNYLWKVSSIHPSIYQQWKCSLQMSQFEIDIFYYS